MIVSRIWAPGVQFKGWTSKIKANKHAAASTLDWFVNMTLQIMSENICEQMGKEQSSERVYNSCSFWILSLLIWKQKFNSMKLNQYSTNRVQFFKFILASFR